MTGPVTGRGGAGGRAAAAAVPGLRTGAAVESGDVATPDEAPESVAAAGSVTLAADAVSDGAGSPLRQPPRQVSPTARPAARAIFAYVFMTGPNSFPGRTRGRIGSG